MNTFAMMILGCKVNDYEATYVREKLLQKGYREVSFKDTADIYIIFTCCVTNTAESKTRKYLHRARKQNPDAYIAAVGCLVQIRKDDPEVFKDIDLLIGSNHKEEIVSRIEERFSGSTVESDIPVHFEELSLSSYPGKSRAFLKIQDGCNQFCSYCIIPYARGRERSADHNFVLKEAKKLAECSRELVLTGIHTGRYNDGEYDLTHLVKDLLKIEKLQTIRLSSIEMNEITDELLDLFQSEKMGKNLHIPVQALTNETLKAMNRPYTIEQYKQRIKEIRERIPDISISTDLITGFPGESDELFEKAMKELEEIRFSFVHVFPYARKSGTKADKMEGHIDNAVKKERVNRVIEKQKAISEGFHRSFIDKTVSVLIEKSENGKSYGYAKQYFYVEVNRELPIGEIVQVRIKDADSERITGEYVTE